MEEPKEWEIRVQIPHGPTSRPYWNINNVKLQDRHTYVERMMAWYEGECQRAPHLTKRAIMIRLVARFVGPLKRW